MRRWASSAGALCDDLVMFFLVVLLHGDARTVITKIASFERNDFHENCFKGVFLTASCEWSRGKCFRLAVRVENFNRIIGGHV